MDPINNNQQANNQTPNEAVAPNVSKPEQVGNPIVVSKGNNKVLWYAVLIGLLVIILIGIVGFYMWNSSKTSQNLGVIPTRAPLVTVAPQEVEIGQVSGVSDLDNFMTRLDEADQALDQELAKFGKDSDF